MDGVFDDCQQLVKQAFADRQLRTEIPLTSANSINIGRLVPQLFYYAYAWLRLEGAHPLHVSVPSGNFGNLTAGLMAARMGIPLARFVAATNINRSVPDYLATGSYEPRPTKATISSAMDVGAPSNFDRILDLYRGDLASVREAISGSSWTDGETRIEMRRTFETHGMLIDPHTAVGLSGAWAHEDEIDGAIVTLACAHAAKFPDAVEKAINVRPGLPDRLSDLFEREEHLTALPNSLETVQDFVRNHSTVQQKSAA